LKLETRTEKVVTVGESNNAGGLGVKKRRDLGTRPNTIWYTACIWYKHRSCQNLGGISPVNRKYSVVHICTVRIFTICNAL